MHLNKLKVIPEYQRVSKILLSFVHEFYNTRFKFGRAVANVASIAKDIIDVEIFTSEQDLPILELELFSAGVNPGDVIITLKSPERAILNEWFPVFCEEKNKNSAALTFNWLSNHKNYSELKASIDFGKEYVRNMNLQEFSLPFDFCTSAITANDKLILLSDYYFQNNNNLKIFADLISKQDIITVKTLVSDVTNDLDNFILPVNEKTWITSKYANGSIEAKSIEYIQRSLIEKGYDMIFLPGLDLIKYNDINTIPSYTNIIILNNIVLIPSFNQKDDFYVKDIFKEMGFEVFSIDCSDIILANTGLHCLSKTIPASIISRINNKN